MKSFKFKAAMLLALLAVFSLALTSCGDSSGSGDGKDTLSVLDQADIQAIQQVQYTVPSPLELANLLKKSGSNFDPAVVASPDNVANYEGTYAQALNLGIYGADLGYVTYYEQTDEATQYMDAAVKLAGSLGIENAFDTELLVRVEKNIDNQDSLLTIITQQFDSAEDYLKNVERADVATLITAGGWLEGLHLACAIYKAQPSDLISTRIGEQRISLNPMLQLLNYHKGEDAEINALYEKMLELNTIYEQVTINYQKPDEAAQVDKPESGDGVVTVTMQRYSEVTITPEIIEQISAKVNEIRASIIN